MGINVLTVLPGYQLGATETLTVSILNQMAKPTVQVSLDDPFNDQNYFRNGNFYSAYWATPSGVSCPAGAQTLNANNWFCQPNGSGSISYLESTVTPDLQSLFSAKLTGAVGITDVLFFQQIQGDLAATLRRVDAISGWIYNGTSSAFTPTLQVATANTSNNFSAVTVAAELTFPSCAPGAWTYVSLNQDLSVYANVSNGLQLSFHIPSGVLNATSNYVLFSRLKIQTGNTSTAFADDVSLFISVPIIQTANIATGAVTSAKIATLSVTGGTPNGNLAPNTIAGGNALSVAINTTINSTAVTIPDPSGNIFPLISNGMYINSVNVPINATLSGLATAGGNITGTLSGNATLTASGTAAVIGAGNFAPGTLPAFSWLSNSPLNPPSSWTQWDDEFNGTTLNTKWTASSSGAGNNIVVNGGRLSCILQTSGYVQAIQSFSPVAGTAFQFTLELDQVVWGGISGTQGIWGYVGLVGTSKSLCLNPGLASQLQTTSIQYTYIQLSRGVQTTGGTFISGTASATNGIPKFVQVGYDGTNLYVKLSVDGVNWFPYYSENAATGSSFGGIANVTGIVLGAYSQGVAYNGHVSYDFVRKTV